MNTLYISENLRNEFLQKNGMYSDLKDFFWDEEFLKLLSLIKLDETIEPELSNYTLNEVYILGLNWGKCGLTSRYLIRLFDELNITKKCQIPTLHIGTCTLLKGTDNSPNGEHAWLEYDNFIFCPTLMIKLPSELSSKFGYMSKKMVSFESARMLSEYDTYENQLRKKYN